MGDAKRRKLAGEYPTPTEKIRIKAPSRPASGEPLSWSVVGDLSAHPKGKAVLQALEDLKADIDPQGVGGNTMRVALEAEPRKPVLVVESVGLPTFLEVVELFQELELTDRLEDAPRAENGIDAAFS